MTDTPSPVPSSSLDIVRRVTEWLEATLAAEEPPSGLDGGLLAEVTGVASETGIEPVPENCSQFALWSALTALTQEVRLQGRAFGRLNETLAPLAALEPALRELCEGGGRLFDRVNEAARRDGREAAEKARVQAEREMLEPLLDTRERLARNLRTFDESLRDRSVTPPQGGRGGWFPSVRKRFRADQEREAKREEALAALREGCALGLARLDETLARLGVQVLDRTGVPFDPRRMQASEVTPTDEAPDGTVLEVVRCGYVWRGELYRAAQVRVARRPDPNLESDRR